MELFLHYSGLRVYSSKEKGAFCKTTSADRFPLWLTSGLIDLGRRILIGRPGWMGARAAALGRRNRGSAVGDRRSWPKSAIRGSKRPGFGSGRIYASCVIHPCYQLGSGWLRGADVAEVAALGAGNPPACGVRAVLVLWRGCKRFRGHVQGAAHPMVRSVGRIA